MLRTKIYFETMPATVSYETTREFRPLRKTWGYMQRTKQDTPIPLLMQAFGHASQQQTLAYLYSG